MLVIIALLSAANALAGSKEVPRDPDCSPPSWQPSHAPHELSAALAARSNTAAVRQAFDATGPDRDAALRALVVAPDPGWSVQAQHNLPVLAALGLELGVPDARRAVEAQLATAPPDKPGLVYAIEQRRVLLAALGRAALASGEIDEAERWLGASLDLVPNNDHNLPFSLKFTQYLYGWTLGLKGDPGGLQAVSRLAPPGASSPAQPVPDYMAQAIASLAPGDAALAERTLCAYHDPGDCPFSQADLARPIAEACRSPGDAADTRFRAPSRAPTLPAGELRSSVWPYFMDGNWILLVPPRSRLIDPMARALVLARENAYKDPAALQPLLDWVQSRLVEESDPDRLWHLEQRAVGLRGLMGDPAAEQAAFARAEQDPWTPVRCVFDLREGVDAELAGDLAAARALYRRANATGCGSETLSYRLAWLALAAGEHAHAQAILRSLIQNHYGDNFALDPWTLRETVTADLAWMQSCAPKKCWR